MALMLSARKLKNYRRAMPYASHKRPRRRLIASRCGLRTSVFNTIIMHHDSRIIMHHDSRNGLARLRSSNRYSLGKRSSIATYSSLTC